MKKLSLSIFSALLMALVFFCAPTVAAKTAGVKPLCKPPLVYEYHFFQSGHYFYLTVSSAPPPDGHVTQAYISLDGINYVAATFGASGTASLDPADNYALNLSAFEVSNSTFGTFYLEGTIQHD